MEIRVPLRRACLAAGFLCGIGLGSAEAQQRTLTVATITPPSALDPHYHNTSNNNQALRQVFDSLVRFDNEGNLLPSLAVSWRPLDPLTWEVKLRPGVRFHDGTPFEAEDVVFSFARAPNVPNSPAAFTPYVRNIERIEVVDPTTLRIVTKAPNPMMEWDLVFVLILSRKIHGPDFPATSAFNTGRLAVGTGPYRLASAIMNERLELTRNAEYWGGAEPWHRVVTRYIPNGGARVASLLAGEVDLIDGVPYQDVPRLQSDPKISLVGADSITSVYLFPDSVRETAPFVTGRNGQPIPNPLRDARVRRALSMAINRQAVVERLYQGQGRAADQFASPPAQYRIPRLDPLPYDIEGARRLLAEAGYPNGFRLTIHGPNGFFSGDDNLLQAIGQGFTRIGVETQVEVLPPASLFTRATNREFAVFMSYLSSDTALNYMRQVVMTRDAARGRGPFNRQRYSNPAVDEPAEEALMTMEPERFADLTIRSNRALLDDMGVIPVMYLRYNWASRADRVRYMPSHRGFTSAFWAKPVN